MPLDGLREALGQVIANERAQWRRERELIQAQANEIIAGLRVEVAEFKQLLRELTEARLAQVKDGAAGKDGVDGKAGEDGKDGASGKDGLPGKDGRDGIDGTAGTNGIDGKDGVNGADGMPGKDGLAGKDGKSMTAEECQPMIEEAVQRAVSALPVAKDGAPGKDGKDGAPGRDAKLPLIKAWSDKVHYESDVVTRDGSTYQALRDTAKAPPHEDWICLARGGSDGQSFTVRGTYEPAGEYRDLDVVALNGAAFVAKRAAPGECPGEGWQMIAMQGKQGKPGPASRGETGPPGPTVKAMSVDEQGILTIRNADGSEVTCDLYPLLSRI